MRLVDGLANIIYNIIYNNNIIFETNILRVSPVNDLDGLTSSIKSERKLGAQFYFKELTKPLFNIHKFLTVHNIYLIHDVNPSQLIALTIALSLALQKCATACETSASRSTRRHMAL